MIVEAIAALVTVTVVVPVPSPKHVAPDVLVVVPRPIDEPAKLGFATPPENVSIVDLTKDKDGPTVPPIHNAADGVFCENHLLGVSGDHKPQGFASLAPQARPANLVLPARNLKVVRFGLGPRKHRYVGVVVQLESRGLAAVSQDGLNFEPIVEGDGDSGFDEHVGAKLSPAGPDGDPQGKNRNGGRQKPENSSNYAGPTLEGRLIRGPLSSDSHSFLRGQIAFAAAGLGGLLLGVAIDQLFNERRRWALALSLIGALFVVLGSWGFLRAP